MTTSFAIRWLLGALVAFLVLPPSADPPVVWRVVGEGRGTPAVDEHSVYFASKRHEAVAFDAATGRERWRRSTGEVGDETFGFGVVVAGSVVAVGDYNVVAFDRATGALRWRFEPDDSYGAGVYMGEAAQGLVLTGSPSGRMYAVDPESGRTRWSSLIDSSGRTTVFHPIAKGEVAVAGYSEFTAPNRGGVVAVDLRTGRLRWNARFPDPADRTLATNFATGVVFYKELVIASSGDGLIHAFDVATGERRWAIGRVDNLPRGWIISADRDMRPLVLVGDTLISGSLTGVVMAYDLRTRSERWRFHSQLAGSTVYKLAAGDRTVYVPYFGGQMIALDLDDGSERWRFGDWRAGFLWAPLIWQNRAFVSASNAGFYALAHPRAEP